MKDKGLETDYKLIPMNEITDEARKIAVAWYHGVSEMNDIREKHKLASDIMNYARRYHTEKVTSGETTGENEGWELLRKVRDYHEGKGKYNFVMLTSQERDNASFDAWQEIYGEIQKLLNDHRRNKSH